LALRQLEKINNKNIFTEICVGNGSGDRYAKGPSFLFSVNDISVLILSITSVALQAVQEIIFELRGLWWDGG